MDGARRARVIEIGLPARTQRTEASGLARASVSWDRGGNRHRVSARMNVPEHADTEFDLLRKAALALEKLQRSPPEPIVLSLAEFADTLACSDQDAEHVLARLADLRFIEGPGAYNGAWLFRRLTRRGRDFVEEVRTEKRWREIKRAYLQAADRGPA